MTIKSVDKYYETKRAWQRNNHAKYLETIRRWNRMHPKRDNGNSKRTPEEWRSQGYIQRHPELRGSGCELCGSTENLVAHHPDYTYPQIIVTCCSACHNLIHKGVS